MKITLEQNTETQKWELTINDELVTAQLTLTKLFHKAWQYAKGQNL